MKLFWISLCFKCEAATNPFTAHHRFVPPVSSLCNEEKLVTKYGKIILKTLSTRNTTDEHSRYQRIKCLSVNFPFSKCSCKMSEISIRWPAGPISAVGVVSSLSKVPEHYIAVSILLRYGLIHTSMCIHRFHSNTFIAVYATLVNRFKWISALIVEGQVSNSLFRTILCFLLIFSPVMHTDARFLL